MSTSSYVTSGNTTRVYDSSVKTSKTLAVGTYRVMFDQMSGYSLERVSTMNADGERVYGTHSRRLDRIFATYDRFDRSLGVMLSGDKGMGKSLMLRMLAGRVQEKLGLPVIIVDANTPGIATFLDTLGESLVIFDEFEKTFPGGGGRESDAQNQFLGLFDGISTVKRLYAVTTNDIGRTNNFLVNRPGRFHYHIRFDYPTAEQVREYLEDTLPEGDAEQIEAVVHFSRRTKINFDHLRAIAFELADGSTFKEVIDDLNIKRTSDTMYKVEVLLKDGTRLHEIDHADIFSAGGVTEWYTTNGRRYFRFSVNAEDIRVNGDKMSIPLDAIWGADDNDSVSVEEVAQITLTLSHGSNYRYVV